MIIYGVTVDSYCLSLLNARYVFPRNFLYIYKFFRPIRLVRFSMLHGVHVK